MPTRGFKKVVLSRKSDYIVEQIYEALLRGDLKSGQRLSSESELAETFGVSKLTVREAVRSLEQMGVVEVRKGEAGACSSGKPISLLRSGNSRTSCGSRTSR